MIKELLKPLEWTVNSKGEPTAMCPSHYYTIVRDGEKHTVRRIRYQDSHKDDCTGFASIEDAKKFAQDDYETKMAKWLNPDALTDTVNWFKEAKPEPTIEDECAQQGVMFEEMYEMLDALELSESDAGRGLKHLAYLFKTKQPYAIKLLANLTHEQRIERLDAMCDIVVTAAGSSYTSKDDFIGALKEVNASNWSKFENGKAVTDENGKIIKGSGYFKPELDKFVGGSDE